MHALTFFETDEQLTIFQHYLDVHLPDIPNDPEKFGFQVVVDPEEQIIYEEPKLLISALNQSLEEIAHKGNSTVFSFRPISTNPVSVFFHN